MKLPDTKAATFFFYSWCLLVILAGIVLSACQGTTPLPDNREALQQELEKRFSAYREAVPGFEATGTVVFEDMDGRKSSSEWRILVQREQFIEFHSWTGMAEEPAFVIRMTADRLPRVWLHPAGREQAMLYQADVSDLDANGILNQPQAGMLRLLMQILEEIAEPGHFNIEHLEQIADGSELLLDTRSEVSVAQIRMRRSDAMPLSMKIKSELHELPGCLEWQVVEKTSGEFSIDTGIVALPVLHIPGEVHTRLVSCCERTLHSKSTIKLRSFKITSPALVDRQADRVLPFKDLFLDRLWKKFERRFKQTHDILNCPAD